MVVASVSYRLVDRPVQAPPSFAAPDGVELFDTRNDLAAAVAIARSLGYQRLVLQGHSLGTSQVLYYAATDWSP